MRQGSEPFAQGSIVRALGPIAHAGPVTANDTARPPLARLIGCAQMRAASRCAAGVTIFFQAVPSAQHCPAWHRLRAASAASSRLPATSAAWPRKPPSRRTWPSIVKAGVAHSVFTARLGTRNSRLLRLQDPDDLLLRKPAALHNPVLLSGRILPSFGGNSGGHVTAFETGSKCSKLS